MKRQRIKHDSDVYLIHLLPLAAVEKLKRGVVVRNRKKYLRKSNKEVIKENLGE